MTIDQLSPDLQTALKIGQGAAPILMRYFKQHDEVTMKDGNEFNLLTRADQESDDYLRAELGKAFPGDEILSEENGLLPGSYEGRVWMVDPLDGTRDFVAGNDCFSINIGRVDNGVPTLGILIVPARNWIFLAEKGKGAYQLKNGELEPVHTNGVTEITEARLVTHSPSKQLRPIEHIIYKMPFKSHIADGGGSKQILIACGKAEAQVNSQLRANKWDALAGDVIITEAGGAFSDFDGHPIDYTVKESRLEKSFIAASTKALHAQIVAGMKGWRDHVGEI